MRTVYCLRAKKETEGLSAPPMGGAIGEKIFAHIGKAAWQEWLNTQTTLINEHRLTVFDPKAQAFLQEQMERFLFEGENVRADGFIPEEKNTP